MGTGNGVGSTKNFGGVKMYGFDDAKYISYRSLMERVVGHPTGTILLGIWRSITAWEYCIRISAVCPGLESCVPLFRYHEGSGGGLSEA